MKEPSAGEREGTHRFRDTHSPGGFRDTHSPGVGVPHPGGCPCPGGRFRDTHSPRGGCPSPGVGVPARGGCLLRNHGGSRRRTATRVEKRTLRGAHRVTGREPHVTRGKEVSGKHKRTHGSARGRGPGAGTHAIAPRARGAGGWCGRSGEAAQAAARTQRDSVVVGARWRFEATRASHAVGSRRRPGGARPFPAGASCRLPAAHST